MSGRRVLRIALPGLAGLLRRGTDAEEAPRLPAAEWLVARSDSAVAPGAWRNWLLQGSGLGPDVLERFPSGPCAAATGRGSLPAGQWARAEPVHLLTAIDHLRLAAPVPLPLAAEESDALRATLNRHLVSSGYSLHPASGGGWLCECPSELRFVATEPSDAVGRNLRDVLPQGPDAVRVRVLVNELQMLLHEHAVNVLRTAQGRPVVNSVWLWGAGTVSEPRITAPGVLLADDEWLAGLWRLHGGTVRPVEQLVQELDAGDDAVRVAVAPVPAEGRTGDALRYLEQSVFAPVRAALLARRVDGVELHVGSRVLRIAAAARWAFWRRGRSLAAALT